MDKGLGSRYSTRASFVVRVMEAYAARPHPGAVRDGGDGHVERFNWGTNADGHSSRVTTTSASLYLPPTQKANVNVMVENALCAATLAATANAPEPYSVFPVDENGDELLDEPPVRLVPLRRRLTVPRGILGAYDVVSRMDEVEEVVSEAESEQDNDIPETKTSYKKESYTHRWADRAGGGVTSDVKASAVYDLRLATATRSNVKRHAGMTCSSSGNRNNGNAISTTPLVTDLYPGDAERDASVMLERTSNDARVQLHRLKDREKKLGLVVPQKRKGRGGRRRGLGRGGGAGGRGSRGGVGGAVYNAYSKEYYGGRERGRTGVGRDHDRNDTRNEHGDEPPNSESYEDAEESYGSDDHDSR